MSQPMTYWQPERAGITLQELTGIVGADYVIRGVIGLVELWFPGRVRGYYLEGGYADDYAVRTSDIDMRIVFKGDLSNEEQQRCNEIVDYCRLISPCILDIDPESENSLLRVGAVRFQQGTRLVYGEDIRAQVPLKPFKPYLRDTVHKIYLLSARVRGNPESLLFPLTYPDHNDEFYGYGRRPMRSLDWTVVPGTKDLIATTTMIATARLGLLAGQYAISKKDSLAKYQAFINDEWTGLLEAIMEYPRRRWDYRIPEDPQDRALLRDLCARSLAFENDFYQQYRVFLLQELQDENEKAAQFAARRLRQIIYRVADVRAALQAASMRSEELANEVALTLQAYES